MQISCRLMPPALSANDYEPLREGVASRDGPHRRRLTCGPQAPLPVLVQVNISGESTKSGVRVDDALPLAREVGNRPTLALRGFMGIAAPGVDRDAQRGQFRALKQCFDLARADGLAVDTLSMGMSDDLELAVAEGSTEVRIGSALFGTRRNTSLPAADASTRSPEGSGETS